MDQNRPRNIATTGKTALFHYTTYFGLDGIVRSKTIRCSKIQHMNDSQELMHGLQVLCQSAKKIENDLPDLVDLSSTVSRLRSVNIFVASFSENGDQLSQWRSYAGNTGVSIGFSFDELQELAPQQRFTLQRCIYDEAEKKRMADEFLISIAADRERVAATGDFKFTTLSQFLSIAARFKERGFSEENEWRLISALTTGLETRIDARPTSTGLVPFIEFDLRTGATPHLSEIQPWRTHEYICMESVTVGPNREQELQMDSVSFLFDGNDAACPNIGRTMIPYRV